MIRLDIQEYELVFHHPFGVSSNTRRSTPSVFVRLRRGSHEGFGEACIPPYLGETAAAVVAYLERARELLNGLSADDDPLQLCDAIKSLPGESMAARAALDIALHDLRARIEGLPLYRLLGLRPPGEPRTAFTIGIGTEEKLRQKLEEASDFGVLKIKAGTVDDLRLVRLIRKHTHKPLYVDVNQGWRDRHQVLNTIARLADEGVTLVEQPLPVQNIEDMRWLRDKSPLPLIADESVRTAADLELARECFHGVNVKLMKAGGPGPALELIETARKMGLSIMLGCMAESSCGTAAAAHLAALADYVDLDAPLLYRNDPFTGLRYRQGALLIPEAPGLGLDRPRRLFEGR